MRNNRFKISFLFLLGIGFAALQAQTSIHTTGGNILGSGGSASYSVGQIVYTSNSGTNGSVLQGVQQPFEISVVTAIEQAKGIMLSATAYPNPTTDYLILEVKDFEVSTLHFQLFDIQGKLLQNEKISDNQTSIAMGNLVPATYFVKITQGNSEVKIFKIIKK